MTVIHLDVAARIAELEQRLADRERDHEQLVQDSVDAATRLERQKLDLFVEVERLRRENAQLRNRLERIMSGEHYP